MKTRGFGTCQLYLCKSCYSKTFFKRGIHLIIIWLLVPINLLLFSLSLATCLLLYNACMLFRSWESLGTKPKPYSQNTNLFFSKQPRTLAAVVVHRITLSTDNSHWPYPVRWVLAVCGRILIFRRRQKKASDEMKRKAGVDGPQETTTQLTLCRDDGAVTQYEADWWKGATGSLRSLMLSKYRVTQRPVSIYRLTCTIKQPFDVYSLWLLAWRILHSHGK